MTSRTRTITKIALVGGLLVAGGAMAISRVCRLGVTGEEGLQVWYYDQSEGELYAVSRETIPPHEGVGGEKNDGVRAVVVADHGQCGDRTRRRITYLETYTLEYKELAESIRAARTEGRAYGRPIPGEESGFYEKNTLVRRVDDPKWYDMTTPQARQIVAQRKKDRGADGRSLDVCTP